MCNNFHLSIEMIRGHYECYVHIGASSCPCLEDCNERKGLFPCQRMIWIKPHDLILPKCTREDMGYYCPYNGNEELCRHHNLELQKRYDEMIQASDEVIKRIEKRRKEWTM